MQTRMKFISSLLVISLAGAGWLCLPADLFAAEDKIGSWPLGKSVQETGICPQERRTATAPEKYLKMKNPLKPTQENILAGKTLFYFDVKPTACKVCHGLSGNGLGIIFQQLKPKPRNFTCYETMKDLPDGQLFWIIQNGSAGTPMPSFKGKLETDQIWQLIIYLRKFSELEQ